LLFDPIDTGGAGADADPVVVTRVVLDPSTGAITEVDSGKL
jgi:hypothetical protein